jgi:chromosome partitioning protein
MDLLGLQDASRLSGVSTTTIRNYIKDQRLKSYQKGNRVLVNRDELLSVFSPKLRSTPRSADQPRVIAVANQKGGVGKTTTAVALATLLSATDPVLALDCDPQGNMTQALGFDPDAQERTLYNVLLEEETLENIMLPVGPPSNLHLVPANLDLADVWRRVAGKVGLETLLRNAIQPVLSRFRFVIMDCPPSLDPTTINCLVAATEVIVPVDMSLFSVRGMVKLNATMNEVRKVNPDLPSPKILACRTEHTTVSQSMETGLRDKFGGDVFDASIPKSKDVQASQSASQPLPLYAPKSKATLAYQAIVEEIRRGQ